LVATTAGNGIGNTQAIIVKKYPTQSGLCIVDGVVRTIVLLDIARNGLTRVIGPVFRIDLCAKSGFDGRVRFTGSCTIFFTRADKEQGGDKGQVSGWHDGCFCVMAPRPPGAPARRGGNRISLLIPKYPLLLHE